MNNKMKTWFKIFLVVLVLLIGGILIFGKSITFSPISSTFTICVEDVNANQQELYALMKMNSGSYITKGNASYASFASLFRKKLCFIDLRNPAQIVFSLQSSHPEKTIQIVFSEDDCIAIFSNCIVSASNPVGKIEHLGISGDGFISYTMLLKQWYYIETYLPT